MRMHSRARSRSCRTTSTCGTPCRAPPRPTRGACASTVTDPPSAAVTDGDLLPATRREATRGHRVRRVPSDARANHAGRRRERASRIKSSSSAAIAISRTSMGPVGNAYHRSNKSPLFDAPEKLCATCHKREPRSKQRSEDREGRRPLSSRRPSTSTASTNAAAAPANCVTCHMPTVPGLKQAADGAIAAARGRLSARPDRKVHDHGFVGVDYPARSRREEGSAEGEARGAARKRGGVQHRHERGRRRPETSP